MAEIQWWRTRWWPTLVAAMAYLGVTALLLRLAELGVLAIYAIPLLALFVLLQLSVTPLALGLSSQGIHLRTLLRGHRFLPWDRVVDVRAAPGTVQVSVRGGRTMKLPDPDGSLARGLEEHYGTGVKAAPSEASGT